MKVSKEQIELMSKCGLTRSDISGITGISASQLHRILEPEYTHNRDRKYFKDYARKHLVKIDGKQIKTNKRPRPNGTCELCEKVVRKRLHYHHWDDQHPEYGIWVCGSCHRSCWFIENNLHNKYLELKRIIGGKEDGLGSVSTARVE